MLTWIHWPTLGECVVLGHLAQVVFIGITVWAWRRRDG
jgi:hypothetical protein